jgi:hypothetical protein
MQKFQCFANILYPNILDLYIKGTKGANVKDMVLPKFIGRISMIPSSSEKDRFQCSLLTPHFMLSTLPCSSMSVASLEDYVKLLEQDYVNVENLQKLLEEQDYLKFKHFHVVGGRKTTTDASVPETIYVDFISGRPHLVHIISNNSRFSRTDLQKITTTSREYLDEFLKRYTPVYQFKVIETLTNKVDAKLTLFFTPR